MKRLILSLITLITIPVSAIIYGPSASSEMIIVNRKTISITHVGDSYSAGNGAGSYEKSEPRAYRSSKN